ncbi:hypothetical protein BH20ACT23_BH20ACT23_22100 [soil metagenome]
MTPSPAEGNRVALTNQFDKHKTREESPMTGPAASAATVTKKAPARFAGEIGRISYFRRERDFLPGPQGQEITCTGRTLTRAHKKGW